MNSFSLAESLVRQRKRGSFFSLSILLVLELLAAPFSAATASEDPPPVGLVPADSEALHVARLTSTEVPEPLNETGRRLPACGRASIFPESTPALEEPLGLLAGWEGMHQEYTYEGPDCVTGCPVHVRIPDPHGAVGPSSIVAVTNRRVACYDKSGNALWGPLLLATFYPEPDRVVFDPRAYYDRDTGRFFVVCLDSRDLESYLNLAVSKTSAPATSTESDWWFFKVDLRESHGSSWFGGDYPCIGADSQAFYAAFNMGLLPLGSGGILNSQIVVFHKADLVSGTATYTRHFTPPTGVGGSFTLQPAKVVSGVGPGNVAYFAEIPRFECNFVRLWAITDPIGTPTLTSPAVIPVPCNGGEPYEENGFDVAYARQCEISGRIGGVVPLAPRAMDAVWVDGKVWLCHTAGGGTQPLRTIVYYYGIEANGFPSGVPTLFESGAFDGGGGGIDGIWSYMPALGANARDDMCITFTLSSFAPSMCPTIMVATRRAEENRFGPAWPVKTSPTRAVVSRWGDFGAVSADPVDDSFWICHEWSPSVMTLDWSTWWAQITPETPIDARLLVDAGATWLAPNRPNPFSGGTTFWFRLASRQHVSLELFDVTGRRIVTLVDRVESPGMRNVTLDAQHLPSGVYYCTLTTESERITRRTVLVR